MSLSLPKDMGARYSPLYFLASVGAGGLAVTFFMYLMFWVPHPGRPVPIFEDIMAAFSTGALWLQIAIIVAMAGIALFAVIHYRLLVWNFGQMSKFKASGGWDKLRKTNAESTIMAVPLTLAMSINVGFVVGLVFVPQLWTIVEYLFPMAMIAFGAVAIYAFKLLGAFLGRVLGEGGFTCSANNSFAQLLPGFALSMIAVGMAAPAAMSHSTLTVGVSYVVSTFLMYASIAFILVALVLGFRAMMEHGVAKEAAPTLMVVIPILTVIGIAMMRQSHGLHATFDVHTDKAALFMLTSKILAVQVIFGLLGLLVLNRQGYAAQYLRGGAGSPGSYALVCPGVAISVMLHFWLNKGLVAVGIVDKFDVGYWVISAIAIAFQFAMIALVFKLNAQHLSAQRADLVPAE